MAYCSQLTFRNSFENDTDYMKRYKQATIRKKRNQEKIPTPKTEVGKLN